ncbi:MAG TPA: hypothetical protein VHA11_09980 [Bryobacteraceae bacterium]|nr:hypothetical protein [Bryobacteraceae bacterium]
MRHSALAILTTVILGCAPVWAGAPDLLRFVPPDSGVIVGINFDQIRASKFGQALLAKSAAGNPQLKAFIALAGFDPLKDINEIVIAAPANRQKAAGLFLLRGSFDPTRFAELAVAPGMSAAAWHGVQVITREQEQPVAMACLDASFILGGDPETVRATIARRAQASGPGAALEARAAAMRAEHDIWFVSSVPPAGLAATPQAGMLGQVEQASGGLKFGEELAITADLTAHTPKDAETMASGLRLFAGLAASNRNSKQAAAILEKLVLRTEGNSVKLSLAIPEAELEKAFETAVASARQASAPAAAPAASTAASTELKVYSSPKDMGVVTLPPPKP